MRGISALVRQDVKRLLNNALFWVISATLVVIVLVVNLALPAQLSTQDVSLYSYNLPAYADKTVVVSSENELERLVKENNAVGLLGKDGETVVIHTGISEKTIMAILQGLEADGRAVNVMSLHEEGAAIPFNKRMVPVFISFEALIVGFILGGALLLSEKEEGVVKAIRISPISASRYVLSKTLLFSLMGTVYALLMAVLCVGFRVNWLPFIGISLLGSALFTLMGLCFTVFFRDMSSWFFSAALLLAVNMLTAVPYSNPTLSMLFMKLIPSYPIIFAYEAVLFGGGASVGAWLQILAWCAGLYLLAWRACKRFYLCRGVKA